MGADYICATLPLCKHTDARQAHLIKELRDDLRDRGHIYDVRPDLGDLAGTLYDEDTSEESRAKVEQELKEAFEDIVETYWKCCNNRDVNISVHEHYMFTMSSGGMTWGDPPTEAYSELDPLCGGVTYDSLEYWATADYFKGEFHEFSDRFMIPGGKQGEADSRKTEAKSYVNTLIFDLSRAGVYLGAWEEHDSYPVVDWQYEVANNDTRLGYIEWVSHQVESHTDDQEKS